MRCIFFKLSKPIARSGAHDLKLLFHRDGLSTGFWRGHMAWRTWSHGIFYIPCSAYLCMPCMPWMRQTLTQALTQAPQHTTTMTQWALYVILLHNSRTATPAVEYVGFHPSEECWPGCPAVKVSGKIWPVGSGPCQQLVLYNWFWPKLDQKHISENYDHAIRVDPRR